MTSPTPAEPDPRRGEAVKRGRRKLLVLGALFSLPVALGWIAYLADWAPGRTSNYGTLLEPRPLAAQPFAALRGKWVLVQFDEAACDAQCERKLYYMRQIRRAQGGGMNRVERLWVLTDSGAPRPGLLAAFEGTHVAHGDAALASAFPAERTVREHIYLVDPLGNLMLRFPAEPNPSKMVKDLERLLKYSGFG